MDNLNLNFISCQETDWKKIGDKTVQYDQKILMKSLIKKEDLKLESLMSMKKLKNMHQKKSQS